MKITINHINVGRWHGFAAPKRSILTGKTTHVKVVFIDLDSLPF